MPGFVPDFTQFEVVHLSVKVFLTVSRLLMSLLRRVYNAVGDIHRERWPGTVETVSRLAGGRCWWHVDGDNALWAVSTLSLPVSARPISSVLHAQNRDSYRMPPNWIM